LAEHRRRYSGGGVVCDRGDDVPGKTPQKPSPKKPGKSLKEKREAKRDKKAGGSRSS
jgi:hypothetical protein